MATSKQKRLAKELLENTSSTTKEAMLKAGYSEGTTRTPNEITESKGFQELLEKYLPDDKVLETHQQGLEATKVVSARITGKDADSQTDDFIDVPDYPTRLKAVELAYKVKKHFEPEEKGGDTVNNYINLTDEQLDKLIEFKRRQVRAAEIITGEGAENSGESA